MTADFPPLSEDEKRLIECIGSDQIEEVKSLLSQPDVKVDCLDDHGMTPLQHAAYKGNKETCRLLLAHGADVNTRHHDHGYSALMFAALSGNTEVTQIMLEAGANVEHENTVGRNASQMAAFVGQHQCVSVINNFFSKDDLQYYCSPKGVEKEPKLPPHLCAPLYKLIICHNLHPVKLSTILQDTAELLDESYKVAKVLDLLVEKMMKQNRTNEVMGMKFHYLATLVRHCDKWRKDHSGSLDGWIKSLVKGRASDSCKETEEKFIRSVIKSFPYVENQLLQQMVRTLAPVEIGDSPSALSVLNSSINGQRFASEEDKLCCTCGEFRATNKCSVCKMVNYCNQKCQKLEWSTHKKCCKQLAEERIQNEEQLNLEEAREKEAQAKQKEEEAKQVDSEANTDNQNDEEGTKDPISPATELAATKPED